MDFLAKEKEKNEQTLDSFDILVLDDDQSVHESTARALEGFKIDDKMINLLHAKTVDEARSIISNREIYVVLLDISLGNNEIGLDLINDIKHRNNHTQIIVRTGQPGKFKPDEVSEMNDISMYITKDNADLGMLRSAIINSFKQYKKSWELDTNKKWDVFFI